ncbi:unnamed protein product [Paramecium pentaurelia]|uniref:Uncharacterized protein n=1 Tax=Paramecium pentaurelia TaxID=43138 RepID=A0A8S1Y9M9_9CILI|nr:unnamed protein product [Paramecium pentaurelia]
MNQDDRNQCFYCINKSFEYFVKKVNRELKSAICSNCYDKVTNMKDEYIKREKFRDYQNEQLKKAQPIIYEICKKDNDIDYDQILKKESSYQLKNCKEKFNEIQKILIEVEQGISESISRLLFLVQEFQEGQYNDLLITITLGKSMNFLEKLDADKFRIEQDKYFEQEFFNYCRKLLSSSVQNGITTEIVEKIKNCIDFPNFLKIIGDKFNNPENKNKDVKQNYYGFLDNKQLKKTGLGCWNQKNLLYYGIFYQDDFLWGIKVILDSNTQFSLYKGFFSKINEEFLINGIGEMFSFDENQTQHEYIGKFYNEKRQGEGTYIWKPNDHKENKYTGTWQNNVFHGQGSLHLSDQNIIIQGSFNYGVPIFENCQITGKNIPQQDFLNYVKQSQKQTEENLIPKQQFVPPNNFGTLQPQKQSANFQPFNQNSLAPPFAFQQQQSKQPNQVNNQTPPQIQGKFQFQNQSPIQSPFNQLRLNSKP